MMKWKVNNAGLEAMSGGIPSSGQLLWAVVDLSDDGIFILDADGRIATWSSTAERVFGFGKAQVLDRELHQLFPDHLSAGVRSVVARALSGEQIRHFESEVVRSDGMPMPVWLSLSPVIGENGAASAVAVIARDVTEQRLAQAALAEVEYRLEEGEALAHVGSWLWDLRTGAVQWSAEFHRIHGVDPIGFDGTFESHLQVIHAEDRERVRREMELSVSSGHTFEAEYRIVRSDSQVRLLEVRAQPTIGSSGKAVGLRGIGQDVTDLRSS
jgi:PAS domain S-box-containing protein